MHLAKFSERFAELLQHIAMRNIVVFGVRRIGIDEAVECHECLILPAGAIDDVVVFVEEIIVGVAPWVSAYVGKGIQAVESQVFVFCQRVSLQQSDGICYEVMLLRANRIGATPEIMSEPPAVAFIACLIQHGGYLVAKSICRVAVTGEHALRFQLYDFATEV